MPLKKGKGPEAVSDNIRQMRSEGIPHNEAIAIAMEKAGKKRKRRKRKKK